MDHAAITSMWIGNEVVTQNGKLRPFDVTEVLALVVG
jgi:hypothetical protein